MPSYRTKALVLKKTKLGETDLIITMIDEEGVQRRGVAKGSRKPGGFLTARLQLFMLVELQLSEGRTLDIITDARVLESHEACHQDIEHNAAAAVPLEFIEKATAHHNSEPLFFEMALATLDHIGKATGSAPAMISLACLLKLCAALGVRPDADELVAVDQALGEWIERLLGARFADLEGLTGGEYLAVLRDIADFCDRWIASHVDIKLKSLSFMKALL